MKTNIIHRALVWTCRIGNCRGFGIQSPWAYSLVCDVINEHRPYYAYEELSVSFPALDVIKRRICRMLMRMANYVQPKAVISAAFDDADNLVAEAYIHSGCKRCDYVKVASVESMMDILERRDIESEPYIVYFSAESADIEISDAVRLMHKGDYLIVEDIYIDAQKRRKWKQTAKELQGVQIFDLYYCAIIYVDADRYKQNYIINF